MSWRCPGCGAGPYDGSEVVDHVRTCDWVDGAGQPVAHATVVVVLRPNSWAQAAKPYAARQVVDALLVHAQSRQPKDAT